jgi:hypothetical protein
MSQLINSQSAKVPYCAHKGSPLALILSHSNPVHITKSYFTKIRLNINFSPTSSLLIGLFPFGYPIKTTYAFLF